MKVLVLSVFFILGCSLNPHRKIASSEVPLKSGEASAEKSLVQIFPTTSNDGSLHYYFYAQVKDAQGKFVDCDPSFFKLKTTSDKVINFQLQRQLVGRYYLTAMDHEDLKVSEIRFFLDDKPLKGQFKLRFSFPDKSHSRITILEQGENQITFRLRLADKANRPVELPERPEILLEGQGSIEGLRHVQEGVWEFSLIYPEQNQILYFSVRAQGFYLHNLFRYQYVEK